MTALPPELAASVTAAFGTMAAMSGNTVVDSEAAAKTQKIATTVLPAKQLTVPFSNIPAIPASYLWPPVLPRRTPVMLAAPGGTGKGLVIAAIIGIVTTGRPFPGEPEGTVHEPGAVVIVAPEDDANEDLAFRLLAAGADLSLVHDLTFLPDGSPFRLPENIPELRQAITTINKGPGPDVALVALDPLLAMCTSNLSTARNARAVAEPLQYLAQDEDIAMIVSHHTTKAGTIAGSKSLTDAMRAVWLISVAEEDESLRVMKTWKTNRGGGTIRYWITGDGPSTRAVFASPAEAAMPGSREARLRLREAQVQELRELTGPRPLHMIAGDIMRTWRNPPEAAVQPVGTMLGLTVVTDSWLGQAGEDVIREFLANAGEFTGPEAEQIKKELEEMLP